MQESKKFSQNHNPTNPKMKILFIGDVFGSPGRKILEEKLNGIKSEYSIDLVIANAENSAHGKGLTPKIYQQLINSGVDFITMGNHTWAKPEVLDILQNKNNIIRPLNLSNEFKYCEIGFGTKELLVKNLKIRISNLMGNSINFRNMQTNVFKTMENLLFSINKPDIHIVDLHAETTSEKYGFLWAFDGRVDAILGTHTHVPTNDACITNKNTAFICDVGMTGPSNGIIGGEKEGIIKRFFDPSKRFILEVEKGPKQLCSVVLEYDEKLKKIISINPLIIRGGFEYLGKQKWIEN